MAKRESDDEPEHPGTVIATTLSDHNRSAAARRLGVSRNALYNVMNGTSSVTPEMAVRVEQSYGVPADKLVEMQGKHDIWEARQKLREEEAKSKGKQKP